MDLLVQRGYEKLNEVGYQQTSFVNGYTPDEIETVLPVLQELVEELGIKGRVQVVWSIYDDFGFGGDSEWVLCVEDKVYEVTAILQEHNDLVDFINELHDIKNNKASSVNLRLSDDTPFNYDWNAIESSNCCAEK